MEEAAAGAPGRPVTMRTAVAGALLTGQLAWWAGVGCRRVSLWSLPPGDGRAYMFLGPTRPTAMNRSKLLAWHRDWLARAMAAPDVRALLTMVLRCSTWLSLARPVSLSGGFQQNPREHHNLCSFSLMRSC